MASQMTESAIEEFALKLFERLGYSTVYAPDIAPDGDRPERRHYDDVLLTGRLETALRRINPEVPEAVLQTALKEVLRVSSPDLLANNEAFHRLLTEGVPVSYQDEGAERGDRVWLINFSEPLNNDFVAANQFTVIENHQNKRPDLVLFVNGIPLVVMELKNAADENATVKSAYQQIETYKQTIPCLFTPNAILVISDGLEAKAGSLSAGYTRFMAWKSVDGKAEASHLVSQLETLILGMLNKTTLLDLVRSFIVFERKTVQTQPSLGPSQREGGNCRGGMNFAGLIEEVRELREKQTRAEEVFWELVRNKRFLGLKFRRQHQIGHYIVDFYCHSKRLIVELDGGVHDVPGQVEKDGIRDKCLTSLGNRVLRFRNEELINTPEKVLTEIAESLSPAGRDGREGGCHGGITTMTTIKKLAAYHQYYAVNAAVASTLRAANMGAGAGISALRLDNDNEKHVAYPLALWERAGVRVAGCDRIRESPESYGLPGVAKQPKGDKKAGVVWHTQGSGKSLSMVFYTGKIVLAMDNPTVLMITDRNDLDDQLFETFAASKQVLRQDPVQAESRDQLKALLKVASGGVVFSTIQKFQPEEGNVYDQLSDRRNIVVIADEAHRTQYGFKAKTIDEKNERGEVIGKKVVYGFAKYLRDALPNATYLGFTGTPIEKTDVNTPAVFGNYVDVYDIAQAVEDGATVRIFYESRLAKVGLSDEGKQLISSFDETLTQPLPGGEEEEVMRPSPAGNSGDEGFSHPSPSGRRDGDEGFAVREMKARWTKMEALIGSGPRIENIAKDIVSHFEARQEVFAGKGMVVSMSRRIAAELYAEIIRLRPGWHDADITKGTIKVVMTAASSDGPLLAKHHTSKEQRKLLAARMKDDDDPLKLVIVRDMWLTGFDAPSLHTLYIDKPMKGHNLMQAIAHVNRVYNDKPGGLVVDYLGIAADLKVALSFYSDAGGKGDPTLLQEKAVQLMLEKLEVVSAMYHGFAYECYFDSDTVEKLSLILAAEEHILGLEDGRKRYINEVNALSQAFAIAIPHEQAMDAKDEVGFFQAVKARLVKFEGTGEGRSSEELETTIRQVIDQALVSEKVIDVFDAAGIKKPDISILSEEFLAELKGFEHKNVALEVLKKLLKDELRARSKKNLVQSKTLLEMLENTIKKYHNKILTAVEVMDELIRISKEIVASDDEAKRMHLNDFEYAFYTAVANNSSARELMQHDQLRELAVVLTQRVRENASIDWTIKESVRAKLKVIVKRTLRQYGYPPDMQLLATETVLKQAEMIASELAG